LSPAFNSVRAQEGAAVDLHRDAQLAINPGASNRTAHLSSIVVRRVVLPGDQP
jgi:hypothetical protein